MKSNEAEEYQSRWSQSKSPNPVALSVLIRFDQFCVCSVPPPKWPMRLCPKADNKEAQLKFIVRVVGAFIQSISWMLAVG